MSKMIQVRNVPESLHRRLKSRAAAEGLSLSDYLLRELKLAAEVPTLADLSERLQQRPSPSIPSSEIAAALHEGRRA